MTVEHDTVETTDCVVLTAKFRMTLIIVNANRDINKTLFRRWIVLVITMEEGMRFKSKETEMKYCC